MPQFFATNRALENLGRILDPDQQGRDRRHKLSRGGHYFVDMHRYMRYYLGTTDADRMPRRAIVSDSPVTVFEEFLSDDRIGSVVVCVHGFNVELHEAFTWFRILTDTLKNLRGTDGAGIGDRVVTSLADLADKPSAEANSLTAFVGFSWPSDGKVLAYASDQSEAIRSAAPFGHLLTRLRMTGKSVNLVCHSMGNYVACHTLAALVNKHLVPPVAMGDQWMLGLFERRETSHPDDREHVKRRDDEWLIDNYVMLAPDVERRHVTKCLGVGVETEYVGQFYSGLEHLARRITNVYSRFDRILKISDLEKAPREAVLGVGDAVSKISLGLLDFLARNPDQRWEKRLGEAPAPRNAPPGFRSVNATELADRKIDHSDHIDSRRVVRAIADALEI